MKSLLVVLISLVATRGFATTMAMTDLRCHKVAGDAIYTFGISSGSPTVNEYSGEVVPGKKILVVKEQNGDRTLIASAVAQEVESGYSFQKKYEGEFLQITYTDLGIGSLVITDNNYGIEILGLGNMTCERNGFISFNE